MKQEWFEMTDLRRKTFKNTVWIPLRGCGTENYVKAFLTIEM